MPDTTAHVCDRTTYHVAGRTIHVARAACPACRAELEAAASRGE